MIHHKVGIVVKSIILQRRDMKCMKAMKAKDVAIYATPLLKISRYKCLPLTFSPIKILYVGAGITVSQLIAKR